MLAKIYLDEAAGRLAEAYWRFLLLSAERRDASKLAGELRRPPAAVETPAATQFIERVAALGDETRAIGDVEQEMNERLYVLYGHERFLVENARG